MSSLKRTSIYPLYEEYGGKLVEFGGWEMPVQFEGIKKEHQAVREKAGLFDVSHMGEAEVTGDEAFSFLQYIVTNDLTRLEPGKAMYTMMCNEQGGVIDDLLIYQLKDNHYLLILNASNTEKDIQWLKEHAFSQVTITDKSSQYGLLALQGPSAERILSRLTNTDLSSIGFFRFENNVSIDGASALVSRTGYTGEDGFEIYCDMKEAPSLWKRLLEEGEKDGLIPCGLGARDTLRFEARLPLYGQEIDETISPLEAGLGFAVKVKKDCDFIGKQALTKEKEAGPKRKLCGIEMIDKGIPRTGYDVLNKEGEVIGVITSGTQSPTLRKNVGLALVKTPYAEQDTDLYVKVRKKTLHAVVVPTPFYKKG
ncbi:glycine cleavage system aminomethyltransferase GcvT [Alteribacillus iranensis]|uniref:Aminomethyltransferase n=1 Tax=Alteribacillus iranensis TaxID=930128 RepID=A0A1I1ZFG8_9BACI|nr:glycine cleavage system aminomethyltransferase GcvT [Alteribacillus iranensis]SFE30437.1 aminomethyltransferase [Alteribacillus iranensis]